MKIICDACSAKYSIADEKVAGKVFKIRCKKCSNIIVVRGNTAAEQPEEQPHYDQKETRSYGYDDESAASADEVWFLVIDQDQVGPMSEVEVRARFARGEVDAETYTWREGFTDWSPLGTIEPFTDLASAAPGGEAGAAAAMFGAPPSDEAPTAQANTADIFDSAGGLGGEDAAAALFGDPPPGADGVFGGNGADSSPMDGGIGGMAMSAEAEQRLRGERNENSVLFSLNNLAALASDSAKSSPSPSPAPGLGASKPLPVGAPGSRTTATGEGSGLIDIRSMAQVYLDGKSDSSGPGSSSDNALPVFSGSPAFASPAPVLLPTQPQSQSNNKMLYAMLGAIGLLVVAAGVLVILVLRGGGDDKPVANNTDNPAGEVDKGEGSEDKPEASGDDKSGEKPEAGDDKSGDAPKPDEGGAAAAGGTDSKDAAGDSSGGAAEASDKPRRTAAAAPKRGGSKKPSRSSSDKDKDKDKDKDPPPTPRSGGGGKCLDEVGCLLADKPPACCSKYTGKSGGKKPSGGGGNSDLPESLGKNDIKSGMGAVRSRVASCGSRHPGKGQVKLSIKVSPSGSVGSVSVSSAPNAALGNCVASAVKRASFPKSQKGAKFSYPFVF